MTHFTVGAIVPNSLSNGQVNELLQRLMKPFDESFAVPEYSAECYCVGEIAQAYGRKMANRLVGTWDERRDLFAIDHPPMTMSKASPNFDWGHYHNTRQDQWNAFNAAFAQEWAFTERDYTEQHPAFAQPNPTCETCGGSGVYRTTRNPNGKWDWFRVGGRWDGVIKGEPRDDGQGGFNFGLEHTELGNNMRPVQDFISAAEHSRGDLCYFTALVTPEGEWIGVGNVGWWGIVSDKMTDAEWLAVRLNVYRKYPDHWIVLLDAHV